VVLVALAGNLAIAVIKLIAFAMTRSTAMLTEAIHSFVDTGDQLLLMVGQARGRRPPDETHPFGHGMETYFWLFIVALMIFMVGGALSIWQGVDKLLHPAEIGPPWINLTVLAFSAVFEGVSFRVAYRGYRRMVRGRNIPLWQFLVISKDPSLFSTLLEDGAALAGLFLAALGVIGEGWLGQEWADGAASIAIGLLLVAVAVFMANETRSLIAGESAAPFIVEQAREALQADPRVASLVDVASLQLGPQQILLAVTLRFRPGLTGEQIEAAADDLAARAQATDPRICGVFLRPGGPKPADAAPLSGTASPPAASRPLEGGSATGGGPHAT
jgi:cation diffusion facilitator family transporter